MVEQPPKGPWSKADQAVLDEVKMEGVLQRLDRLEREVFAHSEDVPDSIKVVAREVRFSEVLPQLIEASILTGKPIGQERRHKALVIKVLKALHGEKAQLLLNGQLILAMQHNLFWLNVRTGGLVLP